MKKLLTLLVLLLCFGLAQAQETLKIAFVFVGPIGDFGWSYMHNQGRLAIEEAFGDDVETEAVENVNTENTVLVLNELIDDGFTVIFATSFAFQEGVSEVAADHPEVQFIVAGGIETAENVSNVDGRMYQARYLSGLIAGSMTETNIIGYVAAFPISGVMRDINAFTLGVVKANPDAVVQVSFTETWYDPVIEGSSADSLLLAGADIIAQHQDSPAPQEAAARVGVFSLSYNSDMSDIGETVLTGPLWDWGIKYVAIVQDILDGNYESNENYFGGIEDGIVNLAPFSALVPENVFVFVEEERAKIESGEWDVFCGPIYGENDGEEVTIVEEGFCLTDEELLNMNFYVTGVTGVSTSEETPTGLGEAIE